MALLSFTANGGNIHKINANDKPTIAHQIHREHNDKYKHLMERSAHARAGATHRIATCCDMEEAQRHHVSYKGGYLEEGSLPPKSALAFLWHAGMRVSGRFRTASSVPAAKACW